MELLEVVKTSQPAAAGKAGQAGRSGTAASAAFTSTRSSARQGRGDLLLRAAWAGSSSIAGAWPLPGSFAARISRPRRRISRTTSIRRPDASSLFLQEGDGFGSAASGARALGLPAAPQWPLVEFRVEFEGAASFFGARLPSSGGEILSFTKW
jgi:hypothetical protein